MLWDEQIMSIQVSSGS